MIVYARMCSYMQVRRYRYDSYSVKRANRFVDRYIGERAFSPCLVKEKSKIACNNIHISIFTILLYILISYALLRFVAIEFRRRNRSIDQHIY